MVRQWQHLIYGERYSQTNLDRGPDFVKLAEAYGVRGARCASQAELDAILKEAVPSGQTWVIDCAIDKDAMVHPMVPGGAPSDQFLLD